MGCVQVSPNVAACFLPACSEPYTGGTIDPDDTVLLNDRATVTGNVAANGTLQFNQSAGNTLTISNTLSGTGTLIFNRSSASTYSGVLSGWGAVTKQAAGLLTFSGANSYSGLTTISAGTVALLGTGSIGTGGLNLGTTGSPGVFDLVGLTAGSYSLPSTASLVGVGTISGNGKSLAALGSLTPGNSAGTITVGTGLSLDLANSGSRVFGLIGDGLIGDGSDLRKIAPVPYSTVADDSGPTVLRVVRRSVRAYPEGMWLLVEERERRRQIDAISAESTRAALRAALARHVPGVAVWVYGSLVKPGRFHEWSDVDLALESLPPAMSLEYLQSLVAADVGCEVDVCLIGRTRLKPMIEREGERWIA